MRLLFSLSLLSGWVFAQPYEPVFLEQIVSGQTAEHVRVWGRYQPDGGGQALVRGYLESGPYRLRVEGSVFNWQPQHGELVEMWGRLGRTEGSYLLRFHNGRSPEEVRRPRPTPPLQEGAQVSLWLKVTEAGSQPFPFMQGVTEDRQAFLLPRYEGLTGLVCLSGEVAFLKGPEGARGVLKGARRCALSLKPSTP